MLSVCLLLVDAKLLVATLDQALPPYIVYGQQAVTACLQILQLSEPPDKFLNMKPATKGLYGQAEHSSSSEILQ